MAVQDDLRGLAAGFSGTLGVWALSLDTGEIIEWNPTDTFPAASTIKVPILYEVYRQSGQGRFSLTDPQTLRAEDIVPGSGILKDLTPGLVLPVKDLATLMIIVSDNTATNMLIDLVGHDVGYVRAHGRRYIVAMMSKGCTDLRFYQDNEASVLLPRVSAAIHRHFVPVSTPPLAAPRDE